MYNETIKLLKTQRFKNVKQIFNWKKLRTLYLKDKKAHIATHYGTKSHILDGAIKLACTAIKSALTNLKNKNIKKFRIRYLKQSKKSLVMDVESQYFSKKYSTLCKKIFGEKIKTQNDFNLSEINKKYKTECKIHYNKIQDRFTLLIPIKEDTIENKNKRVVGIDPGVRTYLTGISTDHVFEIGNNMSKEIKGYLKKIDKIKKKEIPEKKKKRYERSWYKKIQNKVTDLHWKSIKYLTNNYNTIFIGKWSTKSIGLNRTSNIRKMTKRIASLTLYYKFLQKLEYKCKKNKIKLVQVHEGYTSRLCARCGWDNKELKDDKIFNCIVCKLKIKRDINGARNILIKKLARP